MQYTEEMREFIEKNVEGVGNRELTERFNLWFHTAATMGQIKAYKNHHHLSSGLTGCFTKGHPAHNKGRRGCYVGCEKSWFVEGCRPHNHRPVGSERVKVDGYIEVKVAEPNQWRLKHHLVWEGTNGGIPQGYAVVFLDGDRLNVNAANLRLVSRRELLIMNQNGLFHSDAGLTDAAANLAKLIDARNTAEKRQGAARPPPRPSVK